MTYTENFEKWLNYKGLDKDTRAELEEMQSDDQKIKEAFITQLEFGTAGLRGIMRAGTNSMNIYTVRHATQGIANLVKSQNAEKKGVVIAYDSRNNSVLFAQEAAKTFAANKIVTYIFDDIRPTAELSFAIRHLGCTAGINITASHNPKEYSGYKAYWDDGAQLPPDYAEIVSDAINKTDIFEEVLTCDYQQAVQDGIIKIIGKEIDGIYLQNILEQSVYHDIIKNADSGFKVIYTPLHGSGYKLVPEILKKRGLKNLLLVDEQMIIDGNFPTVKYPNPEFKEVFNTGIEIAKKENCSLLIGTDPDADRVGIVVQTDSGDFVTLSGNQVGSLLLDYIITAKKEQNKLDKNACAIKTIVSTELAERICRKNGVTMMNVLTGFKFIGEKIKQFEESGEYTYLFGFEESYGYLAGTYARDKDAVVASMLIVEMAAYYRGKNMTLYDAMQKLYDKYGYFEESVQNIEFEGIDGIEKMSKIMTLFRENPPKDISGIAVSAIRDYETSVIKDLSTGKTSETGLPKSDVLYFDLANGSKVIVRPSGTEPKIKIYYLIEANNKAEASTQINNLKTAVTAILNEG